MGRIGEDGCRHQSRHHGLFRICQVPPKRNLGSTQGDRISRVPGRSSQFCQAVNPSSCSEEPRWSVLALVNTRVCGGPDDAEAGSRHCRVGKAHFLLELEQVLSVWVCGPFGGEELRAKHLPAPTEVGEDALDGVGHEYQVEFEPLRLVHGRERHSVAGREV